MVGEGVLQLLPPPAPTPPPSPGPQASQPPQEAGLDKIKKETHRTSGLVPFPTPYSQGDLPGLSFFICDMGPGCCHILTLLRQAAELSF